MKILILEDEPQNAAVLKELILKQRPDSIILDTLESISQTKRFFQTRSDDVQLIFADIQLSDGIIFELFPELNLKCPIVFCTAYEHYTLKAFKTNGIDYILKPVKEEDVEAAFVKVETLTAGPAPVGQMAELLSKLYPAKERYKTSILVHHKENYLPIAVGRIAFFEVENEILFIHTLDNQRFPVFKSITEIESSLDPSHFFRINRQVLLNRAAIKEVQPYFNRKVTVKTDLKVQEPLIVSRLKVSEFMDWIEQP